MKIKALILMTALFSASVFATPSTKSLNELADITSYEDIFYGAVFEPLEMQRMMMAQALTQDSNVSDDQRKQALATFDEYAEGLVKVLDTQAVRDNLKNAYINAAKGFTQDEIDALIAFYGSEAGKNALNKRDAVFESYMKSAIDNHKKTIETYEKKHAKKMEDDLKKILNK